ncbi:MAG: flagellar hook-length control protein FliK [Sulfuritalea sp.]|nr:flagellar hook-length control protein FliK [Sulfuritalea sp.]
MERLTNHPATVAMQTIGTTSATVQPPSVRVETPLGQPGWGQEMGEKLTWMVSNNRQQADLVLNPPQLGRIEVTLIVEGDKLSATFASPNAAVRETLENSMARLREVLADAGITLGDTHVGAESRQDAKSSNTRNAQHPFGDAGRDSPLIPIDTIAGGPAWRSASGRGMVDVFA